MKKRKIERVVRVALAGNPNVGKSVIFNNLTKGRQHIGNWPGKTIEKKEGVCRYKGYEIRVVDLPGTYSLTAYSLEELIARNYIVEEKPDVVVDIVDASNLERNLYLTLQLIELGVPLVIALNKMDLSESKGYEVDPSKLEKLLGVPVVPTVAPKKIGMEELCEKILETANVGEVKTISYGSEIESAIKRIESVLKKDPEISSTYNTRWLAVKLLEEDEEVVEKIRSSPVSEDVKRIIDEEKVKLSRKYGGVDLEVLLADKRYEVIGGIVEKAVRKGKVEYTFSDLIDKAVLDKVLGIPIFLAILWIMFQFTMLVSTPFCDLLGDFFAWLASLERLHTGNPVIDGIVFGDYGLLNGVGTVLSFTPLIFFLYFALSILEDCGYMARAAFVMDRIMRKLGMTGRTLISMILGFGCNVPAVYSTRAIPYEEDRMVAILTNPLMLCSARLTAFALLAAAFFGEFAGDVIFSLYLVGIALAIALALIFRRIFFKGRISPFIMELPDYQMPTLKSVIIHMWWRGSLFFKKVFFVIVLGLLAIQILGSIEWGTFQWIGVEKIESSVLAAIGEFLRPLFTPLGWDWRLVVAAIFGFVAKEIVIGATAMLYGAGEEELPVILLSLYTPLEIYAYMIFILVYVPCIATVAAIRQETGSWKWTLFAVLYEVVLAYLLAGAVMFIGYGLGFR